MAQILGYEVQVERGSEWETITRFDPDDRVQAQATFKAPVHDPSVTGIRWVMEEMSDDGAFRTRPMGFRSINAESTLGKGAGAKPEKASAKGAKAYQRASAAATARPNASPKQAAQASAAKKPKEKGDQRSPKSADQQFSIMRLLASLFYGVPSDGMNPLQSLEKGNAAPETADGQATAPGEAVTSYKSAVAQLIQPTVQRGDISIFEDEAEQPSFEVAANDETCRQFQNFLSCLTEIDSFQAASENEKTALPITLFSLGAIMRIEGDIDFASSRGQMITADCLRFISDKHAGNESIMRSLDSYVKHPDSFWWLKNGNTAYQQYREAQIDELETFIKTIFRIDGDMANLGDGIMLKFDDFSSMTECAMQLVDQIRSLPTSGSISPYQIRCGGHSGETIEKQNDFFGQTVQLAARICGAADGNEARFSSDLIDQSVLSSSFRTCGNVKLKGIAKAVALHAY